MVRVVALLPSNPNTHRVSPPWEWIYIIQPIDRLPTIDVTHTVAGACVSRRHAQRVNHDVIRVARCHPTLWHFLGTVFVLVAVSLYFADAAWLRILLTVVSVVTMAPFLWIYYASLCWDMLLLLTHTFEFWFLAAINVVNHIIWDMLFHDYRVLVMLVAAGSLLMTVFLDANLQMRAIALRLFVVGAPGVLVCIAMVALRLTPDLHYTTIDVWGVTLDPLDILVNGTFTVAFFMATKAFRYRWLILSLRRSHPDQSQDSIIRCEMYFPVCRLTPYHEWTRQQHGVARKDVHAAAPAVRNGNPLAHVLRTTQLEFVDRHQLRIIDARDTLVDNRLLRLLFRPSSTRSTHSPTTTSHSLTWLLNAIGMVGATSLLGLSAWPVHVSLVVRFYCSLTATIATIIFVLIHAAHFQRTLLRGIALEIDTWFVSIQATMVVLGVCDALRWDQRTLLVATIWLWGHWMLALDALPMAMRRRLALSRWFVLFVNLALLLSPLSLVYVLFFSRERHQLHNRALFRIHVAGVDVHMEMLSFVASKLFTLWIWMGRFFWRELLRPADAFKLLKHRVQFRVDGVL
jgi:hypothetical protein